MEGRTAKQRLRQRAGWTALLTVLVWAAAARGQDSVPVLKGLGPAGARSHLTEAWGALGFALSNPTAQELQARVLTFHAGAPGLQYGRDLWVPPKATLSSWSVLGPPPVALKVGRPQTPGPIGRNVLELRSYLYDRTGGREELLRSPQGPPMYSDLVRFYPREPGTTLLLDADLADGSQEALSAGDLARADAVRDLVRVFRHQARLSERVSPVKGRFLPPAAEAFDGVDHVVLASDRLADDPAGCRALREWLGRGGSLWVLLDWVRPETVAALLGDALDFHVVDRVGLTRVQIRSGPANPHRADALPVDVEEPIDLVRVLAPRLQALYTVDGWPAAFLKEVGRGRVLFTTLGARGWMRPRLPHDPRPTYREFPALPVPLPPFEFLADELHPRPERPTLPEEDLQAFVREQISYSVAPRNAVLSVFALLFLALAAVTFALSRRSGLEHLGWLGPVLAVLAAAAFVGMGRMSRSAVPPTVAVAQVVDAVPGLDEAQASGALAVYTPTESTAVIGAEQGGTFDLDVAGLEGRVHRRIQTDLDRWHWENLELSAGVRTGTFRHTLRLREPIEATVRFGPDGAEGRVAAGPFRQLEDALLSTPGGHTVGVRLAANGAFRATSEDEFRGGQLIAGGLLTDRQRARQKLYEKLLEQPPPRHVANRSLLLAWAEPVDMHFTLVAEARTAGAALLAIPLQFERTPPGTRVTVPAAFVPCRRITRDGRSLPVATESPLATVLRLRFQVPDSVRPLEPERGRLTLRLQGVGREVVVSALPAGGDAVALRRLTNPQGEEQVEILDPHLLRPDEHGAVSLRLEIGEARDAGSGRNVWRLESAGLELRGRTAEEGRGKHESR